MFEKSSSKISDNILYGLIGGALIIGVVTVYYSVSYFTSSAEQNTEETVENNTPEIRPDQTDSVSYARLASEIATNTNYVLLREDMLKNLRYTLENSKKYYEYASLARVLEEFKKHEEEANLSIKIGFPAQLILDFKPKEDFHAWLARLADYIFVRRFLLVPDTTQVVRNKDLKRVGPEKITKRGNILFSEKEDFWWVEIRGLNNFTDEIKTVANYLEQAIRTPQTISACSSFPVEKLKTKIGAFLRENNQVPLKVEVNKLISEFVAYSSENPQGFLPQVDFSNAENITKLQRETLAVETHNFLSKFNTKIIPVMKELPCDDAQCKEDRTNNYITAIGLMKKWIQRTELSKILEQSLFIK
jgi:hypothetical protein